MNQGNTASERVARQTYNLILEARHDIQTIKTIVIFWFVLTIIAGIGAIIAVASMEADAAKTRNELKHQTEQFKALGE